MKFSGASRRMLGVLVIAICGLVAITVTGIGGRGSSAAQIGEYRLTVPLLAADSAGGSALPAPTHTPTKTGTATATATATATQSPTPAAVPGGQSAYLLVQSWYDHVGTDLYGQYAHILNKQAAGETSLNAAGQQLFAFEPIPKAYKVYLDMQGSAFSNASATCDQARQTLGLAAGWLSLMAGWGGLILTGAGDYFAQRQTASDNYFAMMSESLVLVSNCSGIASGVGPPPTSSVPPAFPTATPTLPASGGSACFGTRTTADWRLQVTAPQFSDDLFDVVVTPLTESGTESSFKVRVYRPDLFSDDSSTKFFSFVGLGTRFHYGFDFFESGPYDSGLYEVELRVDFLTEASLFVTCP